MSVPFDLTADAKPLDNGADKHGSVSNGDDVRVAKSKPLLKPEDKSGISTAAKPSDSIDGTKKTQKPAAADRPKMQVIPKKDNERTFPNSKDKFKT